VDEPSLETISQNLSEDAIIQLKKLEYDHKAIRLGLQGTLWGAWASLITLLAIVLVPVYLEHPVLTGSQIVWAIAAFVVPIVSYGAFIFQRGLDVAAKVDRTGGSGALKIGRDADSKS
jgi:hypothetical protein